MNREVMNNKEKCLVNLISTYGMVQVASQINQFLDSQSLGTGKGLINNLVQDKSIKIWGS